MEGYFNDWSVLAINGFIDEEITMLFGGMCVRLRKLEFGHLLFIFQSNIQFL